MKRIIALSSFLFLLLMTVLPAGVSHAATTAAVKLTGITFVLENGKKINAVGDGNNNFKLDLVGGHDLGDQVVKEIDITSPSAVTLSVFPADFDYSQLGGKLTKDEFDIQFVNGVAVLDAIKAANWSNRINQLMGGAPEVAEENQLFTVDELKTLIFPSLAQLFSEDMDTIVEPPYVFPGYLLDKVGNESTASLTVMTKGWKKEAKGWKVYDEYGDYLTDWYKENGKWYYLNPSNEGYMVTGWFKVNSKWYFFNPSGDMKTGWVLVNKKWYYLDPINGDMKTGWVLVNKKWYYLDPVNGDMKTGWVLVNKKWYYLYSDGHMAANTWIGKDWVDPNGVWVPGKKKK